MIDLAECEHLEFRRQKLQLMDKKPTAEKIELPDLEKTAELEEMLNKEIEEGMAVRRKNKILPLRQYLVVSYKAEG